MISLDPRFEEDFKKIRDSGFEPGRVVSQTVTYEVATESGDYAAQAAGKLLFSGMLPAVGDWVALQVYEGGAIIHDIVPRKTVIMRKSVGKSSADQVIAANLDYAVVVMGLDSNFNLRRLERYTTIIAASGARGIIVLSKADLADPEEIKMKVEHTIACAPGLPVIVWSDADKRGLGELMAILRGPATFCLLGSSGAGKSTLINAIAGKPIARTGAVRTSDEKGKHTTTVRTLISLGNGIDLIDNPGMREIGLTSEEGLSDAFPEITQAAAECKFQDCTHENEPGCAVELAVQEGRITAERFASYMRLLHESRTIESMKSERGRQKKKQNEKTLAKMIRARLKDKGRS